MESLNSAFNMLPGKKSKRQEEFETLMKRDSLTQQSDKAY